VTKASGTTYTVAFGAVSPDTKFSDCKIRLDGVGSGLSNGPTYPISGAAPPYTTSPAVPTSTVTIAITDLGADGKISVGDYVTIATLVAATNNGELTITLIYTPTGGAICSKTFTVAL
jgi:hypothetical protein